MHQAEKQHPHKKIIPPQWADNFLAWYCRPELLEEIQGDAYELFYRKLKHSKRSADALFVWNVIRFFRWKNISKNKLPNFSLMMIKSYLLVGVRNAMRNGVTSFINSVGLALGVAGAITTFIFADQFFHTDDFQEKRDRIYQVTNVINRDKKLVTLGDVPIVLGQSMQEDIPAIEKVVSIEVRSGAMRYGDKVFSEYLYFVDNTFFDVFNYPFLEGNKNALDEKNNIVFTKAMAEKYFGNESALGQTISIKFSNNKIMEFTVRAVVDQPANNTMYFKFLVPMDVFYDLKLKDQYNWDYLTDGTFVLLKPGHDIKEVSAQMDTYKKLQNESSAEWMTDHFKFYYLLH